MVIKCLHCYNKCSSRVIRPKTYWDEIWWVKLTFLINICHFDMRNSFSWSGQGSGWTEVFVKMLTGSPLFSVSKFTKRKWKLLSEAHVLHVHKTWNCSCATTAKKCAKKCDACAKLLHNGLRLETKFWPGGRLILYITCHRLLETINEPCFLSLSILFHLLDLLRMLCRMWIFRWSFCRFIMLVAFVKLWAKWLDY